MFIGNVQFNECHVLEVGKLYLVYHRNIRKGTGGEYFCGLYNGLSYSHEFIHCRVYTNYTAGALKRTDLVKSVVYVSDEFILRKSD
jgi:hypothetical protein